MWISSAKTHNENLPGKDQKSKRSIVGVSQTKTHNGNFSGRDMRPRMGMSQPEIWCLGPNGKLTGRYLRPSPKWKTQKGKDLEAYAHSWSLQGRDLRPRFNVIVFIYGQLPPKKKKHRRLTS